jgi:RNA polymerase sigma-70 factor (ECF subfamily)
MEERSVRLLDRWRAGDEAAAGALFRRYADRLTKLTRSRLPARLAPRLDAEDVVQSAFRSFFAAVRQGRYDVEHGGDLWQLLVTITLRKLYHQIERHSARKRGAGREMPLTDDVQPASAKHMAAANESPAEALALIEEVEQLMSGLSDVQRHMVELRLQGHTLEEIAAATDRCPLTVRRVLQRVKNELQRRQAVDAR